MNIPKLIREIHKELRKASVRNVSNGGCGYFVYYVANELERYGIPYRIRVVDGDPFWLVGAPIETKKANIASFLNHTEPLNDMLVSFEHCWIEIEQNDTVFKFDAEDAGVTLNPKDYRFSGFYTREEVKIALRYCQWNPMYNKGNNKKLRAAIRQAFETVYILKLLPTI